MLTLYWMPCRLYCALTPFGVTNTQFSCTHGIPFCIFNIIILICFRGRLLCELLCTFFLNFNIRFSLLLCHDLWHFLCVSLYRKPGTSSVHNSYSFKSTFHQMWLLFMENDIRFDYDSHVSNILLPFALMNDFHFNEKLKLFINIRESCIHKNQSHKN